MSDITIVFLNWKRKKHLQTILDSTKNQTYKPNIYLVDNSSSNKDHKITVGDDINYISSDNSIKCWARWDLLKEINTKYYCVMDDDLNFTQNDVLEICRNYMEENPDVDGVGYTGVINDAQSQYWLCTHVQDPWDGIDTKVDVIKGRFMFLRRSKLEDLDMTPDHTCDDIKVSSHLKNKIVLSSLRNRFINLQEGDEALHVQVDQRLKREEAMIKYFKK
jgi:hypothetical protein